MVSKCTEIDHGWCWWLLVRWDKDRRGIDCLESVNWITFTDGLMLGWNNSWTYGIYWFLIRWGFFLDIDKPSQGHCGIYYGTHSLHPSIIIFTNPHESPMKGNTCFSFPHHLFDFRFYLFLLKICLLFLNVCGKYMRGINLMKIIFFSYGRYKRPWTKFIRFIESYLFQGFSSVLVSNSISLLSHHQKIYHTWRWTSLNSFIC